MPYGHFLHTTIEGFLNNVQYRVEIPEYAVPLPESFLNGDLSPFGIPEKNTKVIAVATIAMMIDFIDKQIPFCIIKKEDIIEVYVKLKEYTTRLNSVSEVDEAAKFLAKCNRLLGRLNRSMSILAKDDPGVERILNKRSLSQMLDFSIPTKPNKTVTRK